MRAWRRWGLTLLVGALTLLAALTVQLCLFPASGTVYGAPNERHAPRAPKDASPTDTATPTATTVIPPAMTLATPASGQGPVGAHITVTGSNWGSGDVVVGAAAPGASCGNQGGWAQTFGNVRPQADQSIVFTFDWPTNLGTTGNAYSICATNSAGTASALYQVVTSSPPSLTVDPLTTNAGSLVKVTGANFVGSGDVTLSVTDGQGKTRNLITLSPDATGEFSLTYQPRPTDTGDEVLHAATSAPKGMRPALQADAKLHVGDALTPTPDTTPTVAVVAPVTTTGGGNNTAVVLIVALVVGFILAAAAIGGGIFFLVMRNRKRPGDETGYQPAYGSGGGPGYGMSGMSGAYGAAFGDQYQDDGYTGYGAGMGGVNAFPPQPEYGGETSSWSASDEPDPNWRPRPMTGQWRAPEGYGDAPYDNYGPDNSGRYPPDDPWRAPDASYRQPGQQYGPGQYPGSGSRGGRDPYDPDYPPDQRDWGGSRGNPGGGRYPPSNPPHHGSGGGSGGSRGGSSGRSARDWHPDQPNGDDW
jgi:hypothetical protein